MRVLVTGATGFLGTKLVEALRQDNIDVRAMVRATSAIGHLETLPVELVEGSLNPPENLEIILKDVDAVIHSAGGGWFKGKDSFYENNTRTTEHLLDAWKAVGCSGKKLILISSQAAAGPARHIDHYPKEEETLPGSLYGKSKLAAEQLALELKDHASVIILRPPALYGPGDTRLLPLFKAIARGFAPIPAAGRTMSFLHVEDCVSAVCLALRQGPKSNNIYALNDGFTYSVNEVIDTLAQVVGGSPLVVRLPTSLLMTAGLCSEWWSLLRGHDVLLSRDKVQDMVSPFWQSDAQRFVEDFAWEPQFDFRTGAAQTADWYRRHGVLRGSLAQEGSP